MNRFLFFTSKFFPLLLITLGAINSANGQLVVSPDAPSEDLIAFNLPGAGITSAIFSEAANSNHARGQIFSLDADAGEITAISIFKGLDETFENGSITVRIFQGTGAQFDTGTGHTTENNGDDFFVGTTVTPLYSEAFAIDGEFANNDYVTFNFATPVPISTAGDYGFLLTYDPGDGTQDRFTYREDQPGNGQRIQVTNDAHVGGTSGSRRFVYAVHGPSSSVLLGDVNCDTTVDFLDIAPFIAVLSSGDFVDKADIDQNMEVDFLDIAPFIAILAGG